MGDTTVCASNPQVTSDTAARSKTKTQVSSFPPLPSSNPPTLRAVLKPHLLHLRLPEVPQLPEDAHARAGRDHQVLLIVGLQPHRVAGHHQRLAEAAEHQQVQAVPLLRVEGHHALPALRDGPPHRHGVGVLDHHVHDSDGQLVNVVAAVHVAEVQDAGDPVAAAAVGRHQDVEVVEVPVVDAWNQVGKNMYFLTDIRVKQLMFLKGTLDDG